MGAKASHDYSPVLRKAFYEGLLKAAKRKNKTLSEYISDWFDDDWQAAMNAWAKFQPKERAQVNAQFNAILPDQNASKAWLEQQIGIINNVVVPALEHMENDEDAD